VFTPVEEFARTQAVNELQVLSEGIPTTRRMK
jgi:hypothetical protein